MSSLFLGNFSYEQIKSMASGIFFKIDGHNCKSLKRPRKLPDVYINVFGILRFFNGKRSN